MRSRRLLVAAVAWLVSVVFVRGAVALPERCPAIGGDEARRTAEAAIGWFDRNQLPDGRWVYLYDRARDQVDTFAHVVRHSGVTMSLYQAHAAGIDGALRIADRGARWSLGNLVRSGDIAAVSDGVRVPTGASALLVAGLALRKQETGDSLFDRDMTAMGQFLVAMTEPSGAVLAEWDPDTDRPVAGLYSKYFTGETFWALALIGTVDADPVWRETAQRIGRYLTERDEIEDLYPPTPDHWSAYGLNELAQDPRAGLGRAEQRYARRLAGLFGVEVRFESQRTEQGLNDLLRGGRTSGSGLGTLGEGLGSLWSLASTDPALSDMRDVIGERTVCVAGMLADRQAQRPAAADADTADHIEGAWFRDDMTRLDDQQHALSAVLLAMPLLTDDRVAQGASSGDDSVGRIVLLALVGLASINPFRLRRIAGVVRPTAVVSGALGAVVTLTLVAIIAPPLLRGIDVSPPTMLIAAGFLLAAAAVADAVRLPTEPLPAGRAPAAVVPILFPGLLRPATAVLVVATAADVSIAAGIIVAVASAAAAVGAVLALRSPAGAIERVVARLPVALVVVGAIDLVADGVFSV